MDPLILQTLANWAEIVGGLTVAGGVAFAVLQVVHMRGRRRDVAAIELTRSIRTPEFARALGRVMSLPPGLPAEELRRRPGTEDAALLVSLVFESIGLMLHRGIVPRDLAWQLVGGIAPATWERLSRWAEDVRREQGNPKFEEWTEWLALDLRAFGAGLARPESPPETPSRPPWAAGTACVNTSASHG